MIQILLEPPKKEGVKRRPVAEEVLHLAEYVAGLLGPVAVRREGPSQPPYDREDSMRFQLDQGNDWFLHAEEGAGGVVRVQISHRYRSAEKVAAVGAMISHFTGYKVVTP